MGFQVIFLDIGDEYQGPIADRDECIQVCSWVKIVAIFSLLVLLSLEIALSSLSHPCHALWGRLSERGDSAGPAHQLGCGR